MVYGMNKHKGRTPQSKELQEKLNSIMRVLMDLRKMLQYYLGTYSRYIGKAAEQLTASVISKIGQRGGIEIDGIFIRPIKILSRNVKSDNYEIDLIGVDEENNIWIVETTTYPIFDEGLAHKIYRRINRWYSKNGQKPCFILFAYGGIERGISLRLEKDLKEICKQVIILDKIQSRALLRLLDEEF